MYLDPSGWSGARRCGLGGQGIQNYAAGGQSHGHPGGHEADVSVQSHSGTQGHGRNTSYTNIQSQYKKLRSKYIVKYR